MNYRKSLDQFTIGDWLQAQKDLSTENFKKLRSLATKAGIEIPAAVRGANMNPRVLFDFNMSDVAREVRISDIAAVNKFKQDLEAWSDRLVSDLRASVSSMGLISSRTSGYNKLIDSFQSYIKLDDKYKVEPVKVGVRFARHGVFLHYGAGRGYGGRIGSRWIDRLGHTKETNKESLGKAGTGKRPIKDWFNPVLDSHIEELADIAANYCADMIVNSSFFYIGI